MDFAVTAAAGIHDSDDSLIGGELVDEPDRALPREQLRFDIAINLGVAPEHVYFPQRDGVPLDPAEAYRAGETVAAFAAGRWHFPNDPTAVQVATPIQH